MGGWEANLGLGLGSLGGSGTFVHRREGGRVGERWGGFWVVLGIFGKAWEAWEAASTKKLPSVTPAAGAIVERDS